MIKVLLDTDIGTDVDDAVALAYLLSHPQCDLLGITTVTGEAHKRAALASVLCQAAGRDIPIFPGAETPLEGKQNQPIAQQAAALPRWPHQSDFPQGQAIEFLRRTIEANPGEVYFLTIGPLTNAGLLFSQHPHLAGLLKGFVMMGGMFNEDSPEKDRIEWNITGDINAADIVYRAPVRLHRSLGLDVTQRVVLPAGEVRQRFTAPLLKPVLDFAEIWFEQFFPSITFHDPLAAATIFQPDVCQYLEGQVSVDLIDKPGRTVFEVDQRNAKHQVARSVDVEAYLAHYFQTVGQ